MHEETYSKIESFDLIGFKGAELVSHLVRYLQKRALSRKFVEVTNIPDISHVGLAIHGKDLISFTSNILEVFKDKIKEDEVYVFESTSSGTYFDKVPDVLGKYSFGVQLRSLRQLQLNYPGEIFWSSKIFSVEEENLKKLSQCVQDLNYEPYEDSFRNMFTNVLDFIKPDKPTENAFFCSELVAECLKRCGILESDINSEKVLPLDFYKNPDNPTKTFDVDDEIPVLYNDPLPLNYFNPDLQPLISCITEPTNLQIETFDLLGFTCSEFASNLIQFADKRSLKKKLREIDGLPPISHVGLAIRGKDLIPFTINILNKFKNKIENDEIYVFETKSIFDQVPDVFGEFSYGIQLRPLKELLINFQGDIYWSSKTFSIDDNQLTILARCIRRLHIKSYENYLNILFTTFVGIMKNDSPPPITFFSSELVAHCLKMAKILNNKIIAENILPLDFFMDPNDPSKTLDIDEEIPVLYQNPILINKKENLNGEISTY